MHGFGLQSLMDIVALPAGFLVVDLHVERKGKWALRENRVEMSGQRAENMLAGLFAGLQVAALAKPQHHGEETQTRIAVPDRIMLASHRAHADAAERENAGLNR